MHKKDLPVELCLRWSVRMIALFMAMSFATFYVLEIFAGIWSQFVRTEGKGGHRRASPVASRRRGPARSDQGSVGGSGSGSGRGCTVPQSQSRQTTRTATSDLVGGVSVQ